MTTRSDDFARADGGLGSNWTTITGLGALEIVSDAVKSATGGDFGDYWSADTFSADQFSQVTLTAVPSSGGWIGPAVRIDPATGNLAVVIAFPGGGYLGLFYYVSGGWAGPDAYSVSSFSIGDVIKLSVSGETFTVTYNGTAVITTTNGSGNLTTGQPGIRTSDDTASVNDWSGGDGDGSASSVSITGVAAEIVMAGGVGSAETSASVNISGVAAEIVMAGGVGSQHSGATAASDDFSRADGSLGSNWSPIAVAPLAIVSDAVKGTLPGNGSASGDYWSADTFSADQFSEVTLVTVPTGTDWIGPAVRMNANNDNYVVFAYPASNYLWLFSWIGGAWNSLGAYTVAGFSPGDVIGLSIAGSDITVSYNGSVVHTATDGNIVSGQPGILSAANTGAVTNWSGGNGSASSVSITGVAAEIVMAGGVGSVETSVSVNISGVAAEIVMAGGIGRRFVEVTFTSTTSGVSTYSTYSDINNTGDAGNQDMRVLPPDSPNTGYDHAFLWLLPVEPGQGAGYGDSIATVKALNAHNDFNLTCIQPGYPIDPWYADNPDDPQTQQETFTLQLVKWAEQVLATTGTEKHYIIGFSKSGVGGQQLFFRHPDIFAGIMSWDFPVGDMITRFGSDPTAVYGDETNMGVYELSDGNLTAWAAGQDYNTVNRMWIGAGNEYTGDVATYDATLTSHSIEHTYASVSADSHNWAPTPGWVEPALVALLGGMPVSITGVAAQVVIAGGIGSVSVGGITGTIKLKKMVLSGASTEKAVVTGSVSLKKMKVSASSAEKSVVTSVIKLKKMVVAITSGASTLTLFNGDAHGLTGSGDEGGYTLGIQFSVSEDTELLGMEWYSAATSGALPATIALYEVSGHTLVHSETPTWSGAAGSGFVSAEFSSPPTLSADTDYVGVVWYGGGNSWYSEIVSYWTSGAGASGITNGILSAPSNADSAAGQALYQSGSLAYPTTTTSGYDFGVDVKVMAVALTSSASGTIKLKKMVLSGASAEKAVGTGVIKLKKMVLSGGPRVIVTFISTSSGVDTYTTVSPLNGDSATMHMRVLAPASPNPGYPHAFLWLLPVEPDQGTTFGDSIQTVKDLSANDNYNLTCIQPGFDNSPWYGDNVDDPTLQDETFLMQLVAWADAHLVTTGTEKHYLIGFSKSGFGSQAIFWRHQPKFSAVASWDTACDLQLMTDYGGDPDSSFGEQSQLDQSVLYDPNLTTWKAEGDTGTVNRIYLAAGIDLITPTSDYSDRLTADGIQHSYTYVLADSHQWAPNPGWVGPALAAMLGSPAISGSGIIKLKKMVLSGVSHEKSVATGTVKLKKMRLSGSSHEKTVVTGTIQLKKMRIHGSNEIDQHRVSPSFFVFAPP